MFRKKKVQKIVNKVNKTEYNEVTQRHLDHYNKSVKPLADKPATPDNASVEFEISKSKKKVKKSKKLFNKRKITD